MMGGALNTVSHHAWAPRALSLINYLVLPRVNNFVFDMALLSLKDALSKFFGPELCHVMMGGALNVGIASCSGPQSFEPD
jgi:hypothetical protein